ncbi:hypothetical protein [Anaerotruncus massiliensis (ex Togo et al. 2019)]|uniref:hypothetical protein n=1 Tax=Anaerotruncus TaxID=244127 RepID=UPI000C777E3C|nr:hypothetical protein [Anaerotruncus massiliensis (ex Togo et al. 2019)]
MTTQLAVMDAIQALAAKVLPELKRIYTDLVPADFLRPCLLVQPVTTTREDAAQNLEHVTDFYTGPRNNAKMPPFGGTGERSCYI